MQKNKLAEMISICEYFRRNSQTRHLFNSEFEAAQKINSLIGQSSVISTDMAGESIAVFNEVNKSEHYNSLRQDYGNFPNRSGNIRIFIILRN